MFKKRGFIVGFLILIIFLGLFFIKSLNIFSPFGKADDYSSKNILVIDLEKDKAVFEKNSREKAYPASLTKIMTALVAIENTEDFSEKFKVDVDSYKEMVAKNSSMAGFYGREIVTIDDLLYGTVLSSGGEAAKTLAIKVAGNEASFVNKMNEKAKELEMNNTKFVNAEGMQSENQYTSAEDLGKLLKYALQNEKFKEVFTTKEYTTSKTLDHPKGIKLVSTVLDYISEEDEKEFKILGGKSGTTGEAGLCWATLISKNDREYICIVMGSPLDDLKNPTMLQKEDTIKLAERIK